MSELTSDKITRQVDKPASGVLNSFPHWPLFVEPTDSDFDDDISEEEKKFYKTKHRDYESLVNYRIHCTSCDRHLGLSVKAESRMRQHPMLRTLICNTCHTFYNSGEFEKGDDGSELYCRWCGQGGQVYCCSDCPHVFCAKCIKRNLGVMKIREIENTDDWKCFKCTPNCIWDIRALCWAVMRFCDLRTKLIDKEENPKLKATFMQVWSVDTAQCCREKRKRNSTNSRKSEDIKEVDKTPENIPDKIPAVLENLCKMPTIQVKKFASIVQEEKPKEKKPQKRTLSPKTKGPASVSTPLQIAPYISVDRPAQKKPKLQSIPYMPVTKTYIKPIRPRPPPPPRRTVMMPTQAYNGYGAINLYSADNINLSLENLTQGLDMNAGPNMNDDIVCTPDFPLEHLCDVTEEEPAMEDDDDVQCMTPPGAGPPRLVKAGPPPLVPARPNNLLLDLSPANIIQMTENDVNVNAVTGGLKFRVDPQTLSSNKMYRLPDGRIFAINANPSMPGGYSATIVAVTEKDKTPVPATVPTKAITYSAKLSAVKSQTMSTMSRSPKVSKARSRPKKGAASAAPSASAAPAAPVAPAAAAPAAAPAASRRACDLQVPVEWFRYNLIDAVDAIQYSLGRLNKMKKDLSTQHLRSRTVDEMRVLHSSLDRILANSSDRFTEIKQCLNIGMKKYLNHKAGKKTTYSNDEDDDDDDDVEILNDESEPIFIDENSIDSVSETASRNSEVQCLDLNDSGDKGDPLLVCHEVNELTEDAEVGSDKRVNNVENHTDKENSLEETINECSISHDISSELDKEKGGDNSGNNMSADVSKVTSLEDDGKSNDDSSYFENNLDHIGNSNSGDITINADNIDKTNGQENDKSEDSTEPINTNDLKDKGNDKSEEPMDTDDRDEQLNDPKAKSPAAEEAGEAHAKPADQTNATEASLPLDAKAAEDQEDGLLTKSKMAEVQEDSVLTASDGAKEQETSLQKEAKAAEEQEDSLLGEPRGEDREMSEEAIESLLQDDSDDAA